jgi:hypothetical protein
MRTKMWFAVLVLPMAFAAACNGQLGDAVSSIASRTALPSVSLPTSLPTRSNEVVTPTETPTETQTETPTETPT